MDQKSRPNSREVLMMALGLLFVFTLVVAAADRGFAGKWKGETKPPAAAAPGGGAARPGGAPGAPAGGATATGGTATAPAGGGGGGGGGRTGGGRFGGGGGFGGPQKVTLNLKQSKDDKVSGNITVGTTTEDVKDGRVNGTSITFKSGKAPRPIYEYIGELKGEELVIRRIASDGKSQPTEMVLKKD